MKLTRHGCSVAIRVASVFALVCSALWIAPAADGQARGLEDRKCRHILLATEAQADKILARLEKGEGFAKLARRHSFDVVTKPLAGELGWIANAQYEPSFMQGAYSVDEVNGIVKCKTRHGWHLIQVTEIKNKGGRRPPSAIAAKPPTSQPTTRPRPETNKDLAIAINLVDSSRAPGEPAHIEIRFRNDSKKVQNVLNPSLWPLGLTVRYQFGKLNISLAHPESTNEPNGGFVRMIEPGETLAQRFTIQDYTGELESWPIIRMNWRANIFFANVEKQFPTIRGVDGYDALREQWRFYSSVAEQRLNVLPAYSSQERWFVMLHSRGKIWLELQDPGIPGVMEYWINLMRKGTYDQQFYSDHVKGSHFNAGGVHDDGTGQASETFALPSSFRPSPVDPYSFALEVTRGNDGASMAVGSRFFLTLGTPRVSGGALQIARVVPQRGTEVLDALNDNFKVRSQAPRTMLALPFTYDMLPPDVKAAVDAAPQAADPKKPVDPEEAARDQELPVVIFKTNYGTIGIELFEDDCPNTTANFIQLLEQRFYDGTTFHFEWSDETNKGFIQGGSPDGSLDGDAGFHIRDETSPHKHVVGAVSMAKAGGKANTSSSQFFICREDQPFFDGKFTVFGRVVRGLDVIAAMPKGTKVVRAGVEKKRPHAYPVERSDSDDRKKKSQR